MTIDPHIATMPARSTFGFLTTRHTLLAPKREADVFSASLMKGDLHPTENRS